MALASDTRRARLSALGWRSTAEATTVNTARTNRSLRIMLGFSRKDSLAQRILTRSQRICGDLRAGRRHPASPNPLTEASNAFHEKAGECQVGFSFSSLLEVFLRLSQASSVALLPSSLFC